MTYELTGKIKDISTNRITNETTLTVSINEMQSLTQCYDELHQCEKLSIVIDKYRDKRSLNANALCWKMCNEIANILRTNKESVYVDMLQSYGQSEVISVISSIDVSGYFKYYDEFGKGYVNNKEFTHYRVYKGSSEYDTQEMAILLDGIISEAKELGICVMSEQELSLIKSEWNK
jgi:hypothetical protein